MDVISERVMRENVTGLGETFHIYWVVCFNIKALEERKSNGKSLLHNILLKQQIMDLDLEKGKQTRK